MFLRVGASFSLRLRLMASFVLLIGICLVSLSILGSMYYQRTIEEQNVIQSRQMLEQVQNSMDAYVKSGASMLDFIRTEPDTVEYLRLYETRDSEPYKTLLDKSKVEERRLQLESSLNDRLGERVRMHDEVGGILIANGRERTYAAYGFYKVTSDKLEGESWYQNALARPDRVYIMPAPIGRNLRNWRNYAAHDIVMLAHAVIDPDTQEAIGVVALDLKLEGIKKLLSEPKLGINGTVFILDESGDVVYSPTNPLVYRIRPDWFAAGDANAPEMHRIAGENYQFLSSISDYTGWRTIAVFPYGMPSDTIRSLQRMTFLVASLVLVFASLIANLITRSVTKPLFSLQKQMKRAECGDLDVHLSVMGHDEIGQLGNSFNAMMNQIRALIDMVKLEQKRKREAELTALQAQINPHFLYNTLDTIQWMSLEHNAPEIVEVVGALTKLFRISLSRGSEFIPLRDELEHVRSYLYIQKIRYEDKLHDAIVFDPGFDPAWLDSPVLKLIVQPLVENAIYHGIKPKKGPGHIEIRVGGGGGVLWVRVTDDGVGMPEESRAALMDALRKHSREVGYGTFNVHERLTLHFGEAFGLTLEVQPSGGLISEIRFPMLAGLHASADTESNPPVGR